MSEIDIGSALSSKSGAMFPDRDIVIYRDSAIFHYGNVEHGRKSVELSGNAPKGLPGRDHMSGKNEPERIKDISLGRNELRWAETRHSFLPVFSGAIMSGKVRFPMIILRLSGGEAM